MKEVGTLKELGVRVGDVVELVDDGDGQNRYEGIMWECLKRHPKSYTDTPVIFYKERGTGWMPIDDDRWVYRIVSRAPQTPKLWRDMTPEEKGALLLAAHEGKVIEWSYGLPWVTANSTDTSIVAWSNECSYRVRIKPVPQVETVINTEMYITSRGCISSNAQLEGAKPVKLTYTKVDGVIDLDSYKLEYR